MPSVAGFNVYEHSRGRNIKARDRITVSNQDKRVPLSLSMFLFRLFFITKYGKVFHTSGKIFRLPDKHSLVVYNRT